MKLNDCMAKSWRSDGFTPLTNLTHFPLLQKNRNTTKPQLFSPEKGMKLFSES